MMMPVQPHALPPPPCPLPAWLASQRAMGVLVVGHGTADTIGAEETHTVTQLVANMLPGVPVELGFLEVIGPSIGQSLARLAERGCREVMAAPLLLFTAGHAQQDVPDALLAGAREANLQVGQADALGCHEHIIQLARQRRFEALSALQAIPAAATVLMMVGRGSSDPAAFRQLLDFTTATLTATEQSPESEARPGRIELGFVAAARPTLTEATAAAARPAGFWETHDRKSTSFWKPFGAFVRRMVSRREFLIPTRRVIVQPHLLFRGHVQEQVAKAVAKARVEYPAIEWVEVGRLGPNEMVAQALVARVVQAIGERRPFLGLKNLSPEMA